MTTKCPDCQETALANARLTSTITDALKALDEGRYGDVRRVLKTGKADALKPTDSILAKGGPR